MVNLPENKQLILFDGICNLCNGAVQYIINHDKKDMFLFTALQSETGKEIVRAYDIDTSKVDSIILFNQKRRISYKSSAALRIAYHLNFPTNVLSVFLVIPAFVRNCVYDFIAKNRYKWLGKRDKCMVPSPELAEKFLQ